MNYFLIFISLLGSLNTFSQKNVFNSGISLGIAPTQIDGDGIAGFNKLGITFGGFVSSSLAEKSTIQFEINYIQKGSRKKATKFDSNWWAIRLNYVETPLLFKYELKKINYYTGLSYGRLINQKFMYLYLQNEDQFKKHEFAYFVGLSYYLNNKITFETRYSRSILPVRDKAYFVSRFGFFGGSYNTVLQFVLKYNIGKND